jgi:hypothetical protein
VMGVGPASITFIFTNSTLFVGAAVSVAMLCFGLISCTIVAAITAALRSPREDPHVCFDTMCSGTTLVSARLPDGALDRCNEALERRKSVRPSSMEPAVIGHAFESGGIDKQLMGLKQAA